jgi:hypothetical protein
MYVCTYIVTPEGDGTSAFDDEGSNERELGRIWLTKTSHDEPLKNPPFYDTLLPQQFDRAYTCSEFT